MVCCSLDSNIIPRTVLQSLHPLAMLLLMVTLATWANEKITEDHYILCNIVGSRYSPV